MSHAERRELWERCWSAPTAVPGYFAPGELEQFVELRSEVFRKYLDGITEVSEFGCGTGHNLVPLIGTGRRLRGFDWALSAVRKCADLEIESGWFDMLKPIDVEISGAVLTVHAMEQLGEDWKQFLAYLLDQSPQICIHIEPIAELYDDSPRDQARLAYHRKRGYLTGYLTELRMLRNEGLIDLIEVRKSPFGGKDHDAYSVIVWRPL